MAQITEKVWTKRSPTGHKVKVTAWGFTTQLNGKQIRRFDASWSRQEAENALAKFLLEKEKSRAKPVTLAEAAARYEQAKARQRGATLQEVKDLLGHSSLAMVMRYAHLSPEHLRRAVARLDGVLAAPISTEVTATDLQPNPPAFQPIVSP